jgi:RNA polymerase sigma-70 factor (ECF subfamily)
MAPTDDYHYARLSRQGDARAFGELVRRHQKRIYNHLLRMVGNQDEAAELAQEVFLRAYRSMPTYRPETPFGAWALRLAANAAVDLLRRRKVVEFVALESCSEPEAADGDPEMQCAQAQQRRLLERAMQALRPAEREILLLREYEDLSYGEIAAVLEVPEGTVKSRVARARMALLECYGRIGESKTWVNPAKQPEQA